MGFSSDLAVKNLSVMQETQETWVQTLGQEYPLEEEMATHSSVLAWEILWTEEPGGLGKGRTEQLSTAQTNGKNNIQMVFRCPLLDHLGKGFPKDLSGSTHSIPGPQGRLMGYPR